MKKFKIVIRELQNWLYILRTIKKEESNKDSFWHKLNLRRNWYGRIYTVINLREEDLGDQEMIRNWKAMEKMRPINQYLQSLDFQEIIFPSIEKIPGTPSYLVVYSPVLDNFTVKWVMGTLIKLSLISLGIWLIIKIFI